MFSVWNELVTNSAGPTKGFLALRPFFKQIWLTFLFHFDFPTTFKHKIL